MPNVAIWGGHVPQISMALEHWCYLGQYKTHGAYQPEQLFQGTQQQQSSPRPGGFFNVHERQRDLIAKSVTR